MQFGEFDMKHALASLLLLFAIAFANNADAVCLNTAPPTMQVKFKNNSSETVYLYIESPIILTPGSPPARPGTADLWLQAQCQIAPTDSFVRPFFHTRLNRAWINVQNRAALGNSAAGTPPLSTTGIPPGNTVNITLPFYTQLRSDVTAGNLGEVADQFIDWWNAVRLVVFYRVEGAVSIFDKDLPQPVAFNASGPAAMQPSCTTDIVGSPGCFITHNSYDVQPFPNVGFQLQEFTLASANGPLPGGNALQTVFSIDTIQKNNPNWIYPNLNYNISSLDSVYLPMAIGPMKNPIAPGIPSTDNTNFLGSTDNVSDFVGKLRAFSGQNADGSGWPYYIPMYIDSKQTVMCGPNLCWTPIYIGDAPCSMNTHFRIPNQYVFPKIPGTANMLFETFNHGFTAQGGFNVTNPPTLSSQPVNYQTLPGWSINVCHSPVDNPYLDPLHPPNSLPPLGTMAKQLFDLWTNCTTNPSFPDVNGTCTKIKDVNKFFQANYAMTCGHAGAPDLVSTIFAVYGWVPIKAPLILPTPTSKQCIGPALSTNKPAFDAAFAEYCDLQYNYLTLPAGNDQYIFNPYAKLIHSPNLLNSTAYAFSVDDGVSFRQIHNSPGMIFAFGGSSGLDFPTGTPVPDGNPSSPSYYKHQCNSH
jgi:hypothetical protein